MGRGSRERESRGRAETGEGTRRRRGKRIRKPSKSESWQAKDEEGQGPGENVERELETGRAGQLWGVLGCLVGSPSLQEVGTGSWVGIINLKRSEAHLGTPKGPHH